VSLRLFYLILTRVFGWLVLLGRFRLKTAPVVCAGGYGL
jgi:hypothetical protein